VAATRSTTAGQKCGRGGPSDPVKTGSASFRAELQIYAVEGKIGDDPLQSAMLTSNFSGTIHDVEIHF